MMLEMGVENMPKNFSCMTLSNKQENHDNGKKYKDYVYSNFFKYTNGIEVSFYCPNFEEKKNVLENFYFKSVLNSISRDNKNRTNGPDGYYILNNDLVMIEHFEFDASAKTEKGSEFKKQIGEVKNKNIREKLLNHEENKNFYLKNALSTMQGHYDKFNIYLENLKQDGLFHEGMKIHMVFLIEDSTPVPCFIKNKKEATPLNLFKISDFLDDFQKMPLLDAAFLSINFITPDVYMITKENYNEYKKVKYDIDNIELIKQPTTKFILEDSPLLFDRNGVPKEVKVFHSDFLSEIRKK